MLLFIRKDPQNEWVQSPIQWNHLKAIYDLIRQPIAETLGNESDWAISNDITLDAFDTIALDELPANAFNLAYKLIMSSQDNLIKPYISDLKPLFESDPRFQAA